MTYASLSLVAFLYLDLQRACLKEARFSMDNQTTFGLIRLQLVFCRYHIELRVSHFEQRITIYKENKISVMQELHEVQWWPTLRELVQVRKSIRESYSMLSTHDLAGADFEQYSKYRETCFWFSLLVSRPIFKQVFLDFLRPDVGFPVGSGQDGLL